MDVDNYLPRVADSLLKDALESTGAVLIEGPKWCGKTTTATNNAASLLKMDKPSEREENIRMAGVNPETLLKGKTPRLIDEWQIATKLWDAVRYEVDERGKMGQFILTGSAVPADSEAITHTGTGRFAWLKMRPMALGESGNSSQEVSLGGLFKNTPSESNSTEFSGISPLDDIEKLAFLTCRGGWPQATKLTEKNALNTAKNYFTGVVKSDINRADGVEKNENRARRLMRSYARHMGTPATYTMIRDDIAANESDTLNEETVSAYVNALRMIFVVEDMPAWNPNLRSKTAIRTADTRYYVDPSIAAAALGLGPQDLINDLNTFGFLFETLCVRDLRVYAEFHGGQVFHYRDKTGLECDAVVHLPNGEYGLIEIKLGGEIAVHEAAKNLNKLAGIIDTTRMKPPSFKMVLTGVSRYAYQREDGILVCPIGCLGV